MEQLFLILELVGTLAFAASGAITGLKKNMDVFGVCILGLTTAVGGGVIRDLLLGITPPGTFQDPIYAVVALLTSLVLFLPRIRRLLMWDQRLYDLVLLIMDSAGLGIFTVAGIRIAYEHAARPTLFLLVFVAVVTGVGGGVLRDQLAGDTPYIFVKHVYASASLAGAILCAGLWSRLGSMAWASWGEMGSPRRNFSYRACSLSARVREGRRSLTWSCTERHPRYSLT